MGLFGGIDLELRVFNDGAIEALSCANANLPSSHSKVLAVGAGVAVLITSIIKAG